MKCITGKKKNLREITPFVSCWVFQDKKLAEFFYFCDFRLKLEMAEGISAAKEAQLPSWCCVMPHPHLHPVLFQQWKPVRFFSLITYWLQRRIPPTQWWTEEWFPCHTPSGHRAVTHVTRLCRMDLYLKWLSRMMPAVLTENWAATWFSIVCRCLNP